eukprot:7705666-Alexandrium_andersonii.AAC.1
MSASLVGSEMCIRDRCRLAEPYAEWVRPGHMHAHRVFPMPQEGNDLTSVSYTHLTLPTICSV